MTTIHHCTTSTPHSPHTVDRGAWGRGWCSGVGSTPVEPTAVTEDEVPADTEVAGSPVAQDAEQCTDGTWDRALIQGLLDNLDGLDDSHRQDGDRCRSATGDHLRALLADRDALACVVGEIRDDLGEGSEGELATLAADVRAVRESVKQQLAEVTADRDGLREYATTATYHQERHAEAYREVVRLRGELDDRERQYRDMVDAAERREALIFQNRRYMASCVWVDPGRMSGAPCLGGTRIRVSTIAGLLADGLSGDQVRESYRDVTDEHLVAVRHFVAEVDGTELVDRLRGELEQARQDHPAVDLDWWSRDAGANALEWAAGRAERLFGTTTDHPPLLTSPDLRAMAAELRSGERHIGERHIEPRPAAPTATTEPTEGNQP